MFKMLANIQRKQDEFNSKLNLTGIKQFKPQVFIFCFKNIHRSIFVSWSSFSEFNQFTEVRVTHVLLPLS